MVGQQGVCPRTCAQGIARIHNHRGGSRAICGELHLRRSKGAGPGAWKSQATQHNGVGKALDGPKG